MVLLIDLERTKWNCVFHVSVISEALVSRAPLFDKIRCGVLYYLIESTMKRIDYDPRPKVAKRINSSRLIAVVTIYGRRKTLVDVVTLQHARA